ncbi:PoNe immunity protein domain-containing protein [Photobacterium kagoshimensis]|uniref:PoNe immunity protein domain-containing protein n=1 Tax=Photobacterium kagoshimensis TaxID=2910242 RepID=UPI003D0BE1CD
MLRDKLKDKAYFDDRVDFRLECIEEDIDDIKNDDSESLEVKMLGSFRTVSDITYLLHQKYSRGDDLVEFKAHLETALEYRGWQKHYADALPRKEQKNRIGWEEIREDYLENWLDWLAFAYCLEMGPDYYQQVFDLMANQGLDALFDKIAVEMGDSSRKVSDTLLFKKRFKKLYTVIEAEPEQRPKLMLAYLNAWYKLIESPDYHLMDTDAYIGYWCWESALIVRLYDIDDSSFIDHEYYPKDLVHWQSNK